MWWNIATAAAVATFDAGHNWRQIPCYVLGRKSNHKQQSTHTHTSTPKHRTCCTCRQEREGQTDGQAGQTHRQFAVRFDRKNTPKNVHCHLLFLSCCHCCSLFYSFSCFCCFQYSSFSSSFCYCSCCPSSCSCCPTMLIFARLN